MTGLAWGGQFVVGKSALGTIDAFPLSTIRYAVAGGLWLIVLALVEGRKSFRLEGRGLRLFWLGALGFGGFNLLAYTGLAHARPESASLIVALAPLLTALVLWQRSGVRPPTPTLVLLVVALAGVALVIGGGNPVSIFDGAIGYGDLLVLGGVFSFVLYGLGAAGFRDFSPLRYTALTAGFGCLVLAAATVVALALGLAATPSPGRLWAVGPQIAYLAIPGAFVAVLTWNGAIRLIGPQNAVLFGNLIPVTTFAIEIARGYRPGAAALAGALVTVGALIANNLIGRRPSRAADRPAQVVSELEPARASSELEPARAA
jgi:drug/metabolite transporter (DMT)-like permease